MKKVVKPEDAWLLEMKKNMSCAQIAKAYDVKPHTVDNWLCMARKKKRPDDETLHKLSFSDFFGGTKA